MRVEMGREAGDVPGLLTPQPHGRDLVDVLLQQLHWTSATSLLNCKLAVGKCCFLYTWFLWAGVRSWKPLKQTSLRLSAKRSLIDPAAEAEERRLAGFAVAYAPLYESAGS